MEFKDTLNLPQTEFPMKGNLPNKEPEILSFWEKINLYQKLREDRKGKDKYILHDGPPYANGHIHIGHALNKILKDILVKYQSMKGKDAPFVPGWDCHGLPIEQQVEKELKEKKIKKEDLSKSEFRKLCREYALKFVNIQKEEFKRLGIIGNWEKPYLTMRPSYQAQEVLELGRVFNKGVAYRGKKPVYWCIYDKTAEAEAEIEYYDKKDPSIYVKFKMKDSDDTYLVIWTTTPWTLPANLGVMVHPEFDYVYFKTGKGTLIVAKELLENFKEKTGLNGEVIKQVKGKDLEFKEYYHPFIDRVSKVYLSEFVELGTGTGLVHMAPGHGQEDYIIGQRYGVDAFAPVDDEGRFIQEAPDWLKGIRVFDANDLIIEKLQEVDALIYKEVISHSYPHCWRCKNPVIFRATPQWFISMEAKVNENQTLREAALKEIERVKWIPYYGQNRIKSMVENRPDWCISRQRSWGVPITVFYCENCGEIVKDMEVFEHVANLIKNDEFGADIWFEKLVKELLPEGYKCKKCGGQEFKKEEDILDVWFDSGVSHAAVLKYGEWEELRWPADMYLEGSDQHRGWFQSSLLESVASYNRAPYDTVLTHGFTLDEKGRKMSKSAGNVVAPEKVIKEYGADILRLWVVTEDYTEDIKIGFNLIKRIAEDYRKIRNTFRYFLGNLYDFNPNQDYVPYENLLEIDRWMLSKLQNIIQIADKSYEEGKFHKIYHTIKNFVIVDLSAIYLDILKDRLYVYAPKSLERKSAQTVLWELLLSLNKILAPIISFTAEEVWQYVRKIDSNIKESIHLEIMPVVNEKFIDKNLEETYEKLLEVRDDILKAIEEARKQDLVRHPYEARVILKLPKEYKEIVEKRLDWIKFFFTVSQVELSDNPEGDVVINGESVKDSVIAVSKAKGEKCPRCWIYDESVGRNGQPVCDRCKIQLEIMNIKLEELA
ncbi:isoleucyl-tRNA synthetase [Sulfurihydrogenibium sp. YO3AOP1]|uniref:Isoleucine--tRNA ligase n=1 Tax=Sulfurihydrogenibium sp. (strain YO3AOP1) TaxID=436114 RepID=SYI_SULSY|nr:isoleucine--tRNA ligase [Sulfurihydrogenibium sp. YO3AOP1]B2V9T1.1 RecName: Full=Isoleucine--tRNA ligase; AltName: Full=Isoleucyl-tRNA synthetase; Short=IleRS [Sulfurihydrogenibium sp. YO3AOP1]ACD66704.1 isoleucyl-tRNA synthetase [Sulfurihydrogenibium sp. YO3AOP1]